MLTTEIILPVHNGLSLLRDGLDAVLAYTPRGASRLRVVDDASNAATAAWLREQAAAHTGWMTLQRQDENLGFLATCNRAMAVPESARQLSDYLLLLNSDVLVTPGWLERLLACAESDSRIAAVNPLSNRADNIDLPMAPGASYLSDERVSGYRTKRAVP
jgi:GT2 family glycosyltransferase